jgi:5-methylcytosine-specific restriction endonuclease McrA
MISAATRRFVRERAENRCEYCRTRQVDEPFISYQIEHVIAVQHGGDAVDGNLALACSHCNLHKGPNLAGIDPESGHLEPLFHPRKQAWADHFRMNGPEVVGTTPTGRTTVRVLAMNAAVRVDLRRAVLDAETE